MISGTHLGHVTEVHLADKRVDDLSVQLSLGGHRQILAHSVAEVADLPHQPCLSLVPLLAHCSCPRKGLLTVTLPVTATAGLTRSLLDSLLCGVEGGVGDDIALRVLGAAAMVMIVLSMIVSYTLRP